MKPITKSEWLKDVAKEVEALKKNATQEEIENLDFDTLNPDEISHCIYGQMTGSCTSSRAIELIHKSCNRFTLHGIGDNFRETRGLINGNVASSRVEDSGGFNIKYYSAIETYILLKDSKPQNIIAYLKGETNKLIL